MCRFEFLNTKESLMLWSQLKGCIARAKTLEQNMFPCWYLYFQSFLHKAEVMREFFSYDYGELVRCQEFYISDFEHRFKNPLLVRDTHMFKQHCCLCNARRKLASLTHCKDHTSNGFIFMYSLRFLCGKLTFTLRGGLFTLIMSFSLSSIASLCFSASNFDFHVLSLYFCASASSCVTKMSSNSIPSCIVHISMPIAEIGSRWRFSTVK